MQSILSGIVGVFAFIVLLLAIASRNEIVARVVFSCIGTALLGLSIAGFGIEASWVWWSLLLVCGLGVAVLVWAGIMVTAIAHTYGKTSVRRIVK